MSTVTTIAEAMTRTGWGDRRQSLFIDKMIQSNSFLSRMTIVDGVKSKSQIPTYDATLLYGNNICDLTEGTGGTMELGEKEVTVSDHTWYFSNCKKTLEGSYRSKLLKKGQTNEESLDADLLDWLLNHFSKLNALKAVQLCAQELRAELKADAGVKKVVTDKTDILGILEDIYLGIPDGMLEAMYGEMDRDVTPVIFLSPSDLRKYKLAIAKAYNTVYDGTAEGKTMPYMGLEVACFNQLEEGEILVCQPNNLLIITDDYADVNSIQHEFQKKTNSDEFYGLFKLGFSYRYNETIVYRAKPVANLASEEGRATRAAKA